MHIYYEICMWGMNMRKKKHTKSKKQTQLSKQKRIDILTIYQPQECVNADNGSYITITNVKSMGDLRISKTLGNINLTDYWFAQGKIIQNQELSYACQCIPLLSDEEILSDKSVYDNDKGKIDPLDKMVCIQFIKVFVENKSNNYTTENDIKNLRQNISDLIDKTDGIKGKCYRTIDNADLICILVSHHQSCLEKYNQNFEAVFNAKLFSLYSIIGKLELKENTLFIREYDKLSVRGCNKNKLYKGWCFKTAQELKDDLKKYETQMNKKMEAYYRSLFKTVNVLAQYEQEKLLKDLFFIFYPQISLFVKQLKCAEDKIIKEKNKKEKYKQIEYMESALSQFIDSIEELLYHMGHSCRDILSESGKGGMPFDIPIRLCLMYMAFLSVLTNVLNDTNLEYRYCLYPVTYSKPSTKCILYNERDKSSMIQVKVSKHTMFSPRSFLIILAHEVSHYVNQACRNRCIRTEKIIAMLSLILVDRLTEFDIGSIDTNKDNSKADNEIIALYKKMLQDKLYEYIYTSLKMNLKEKKIERKDPEEIYEIKELWENEKEICAKILYDESGKLKENVDYIGGDLMNNIQKRDNSFELIRDIHIIQKGVYNNRIFLLYDQKHLSILKMVMDTLKEIYADISAIQILNLTLSEYLEAYFISESYIPEGEEFESNELNRFSIVNYVLCVYNKEWKKEWNNGNVCINDSPFLKSLKRQIDDYSRKIELKSLNVKKKEEKRKLPEDSSGDIFYSLDIVEMEIEYLMKCYESLNFHLKNIADNDEKKASLSAIRELYQCFKVYNQGEDILFEDFFQRCDNLVTFYRKEISDNRAKELK